MEGFWPGWSDEKKLCGMWVFAGGDEEVASRGQDGSRRRDPVFKRIVMRRSGIPSMYDSIVAIPHAGRTVGRWCGHPCGGREPGQPGGCSWDDAGGLLQQTPFFCSGLQQVAEGVAIQRAALQDLIGFISIARRDQWIVCSIPGFAHTRTHRDRGSGDAVWVWVLL